MSETHFGYQVQEFHCNKCPGYVIVRLNMDLNRRVLLVCPMCGRRHQRQIRNGVLYDVNKFNDESNIEEIHVPKSAFSKKPRTHAMEEASKRNGLWQTLRDGAVIDSPRSLIEESWFDRYGVPAHERTDD